MSWHSPLLQKLTATSDSDSFRTMTAGTTGVPFGDHVGAFGVQRQHHVHEGVDLYCEEGSAVLAVEDGEVVAVIHFTGPDATPPSTWWLPTQAILVEGQSGVVVYGEITNTQQHKVSDRISRGQLVGNVARVLIRDKGRPLTMLHLELHAHGTRDAYEWISERPASLLDPTPYLLECCE